MLFTSISFLYYFLPIVLLGYFIVPNKIKNYWLLISSLIFYLYGDSKYLLLMISEIFICYIGGLVLEKHKNKYLLTVFLIIHLGLLGYFKYIDFLIRSINNIFNSNLNNIAQDNLFNSSFDAKNINMKSGSTYVFTRTKDENSSMSQNIKFPLATGQIRQLINPNGVSIKASQIINSSSSKQYYIDAGVIITE